ncbi:hypothetical protein HK405_008288, partial [Cladochytrium tenue]
LAITVQAAMRQATRGARHPPPPPASVSSSSRRPAAAAAAASTTASAQHNHGTVHSAAGPPMQPQPPRRSPSRPTSATAPAPTSARHPVTASSSHTAVALPSARHQPAGPSSSFSTSTSSAPSAIPRSRGGGQTHHLATSAPAAEARSAAQHSRSVTRTRSAASAEGSAMPVLNASSSSSSASSSGSAEDLVREAAVLDDYPLHSADLRKRPSQPFPSAPARTTRARAAAAAAAAASLSSTGVPGSSSNSARTHSHPLVHSPLQQVAQSSGNPLVPSAPLPQPGSKLDESSAPPGAMDARLGRLRGLVSAALRNSLNETAAFWAARVVGMTETVCFSRGVFSQTENSLAASLSWRDFALGFKRADGFSVKHWPVLLPLLSTTNLGLPEARVPAIPVTAAPIKGKEKLGLLLRTRRGAPRKGHPTESSSDDDESATYHAPTLLRDTPPADSPAPAGGLTGFHPAGLTPEEKDLPAVEVAPTATTLRGQRRAAGAHHRNPVPNEAASDGGGARSGFDSPRPNLRPRRAAGRWQPVSNGVASPSRVAEDGNVGCDRSEDDGPDDNADDADMEVD